MWKPKYFHEMITNSVNITMFGSPSQSWTRAPSPTAPSDGVDERAGLQQQPEHDAGDRLGEDVRQEEQQPEQPPGRGTAG